MRGPKKIFLIAGARPNFMKIAPVHEAMKQDGAFDPVFVHTGQHYDDRMSRVFIDELGLPEPDLYLGVGSASHAVQTARIMIEFEKVVLENRPDMVMVVGDVNSTLACALVASKLHIPIAHVEAGLRSGDWTMPEEVNRVLTDRLSDYLLIHSPEATANLITEGIDEDRIHFVGNTMIESLIKAFPLLENRDIFKTLGVSPHEYALVTLHRPSNVDDEKAFKGILDALETIGKGITVLFPAHPRSQKRIKEFGFSNRNIRIMNPLGYTDFLALEARAKLVLTDSGGVQEETTFFGVPCITIRENTERPITILEGTNILVGTDPERIKEEGARILAGDSKQGRIPKYWDDRVAERIVGVMKEGM